MTRRSQGLRGAAPPKVRMTGQSSIRGTRRGARMSGKFSLKPLDDRIVVKAIEEEDTTASGLVIPDTAKERPQEGEVIAVGPGRFEEGQRIPMDVKAGDKVIYSKY